VHGVKGAGIHCAGQKRESRDNHDGGNQALPLIHDGFRRLFDDGQSHVRGIVQLLPLRPSVTFASSRCKWKWRERGRRAATARANLHTLNPVLHALGNFRSDVIRGHLRHLQRCLLQPGTRCQQRLVAADGRTSSFRGASA